MPGADAICPKCPVEEHYLVQDKQECPKVSTFDPRPLLTEEAQVEKMECPTDFSETGTSAPRGVDGPLPFYTEYVGCFFLAFFLLTNPCESYGSLAAGE